MDTRNYVQVQKEIFGVTPWCVFGGMLCGCCLSFSVSYVLFGCIR